MEFDWDQGNINKNLKHGAANKESEEPFFNKPLKIFKDPKHSQVEQRFVAYGTTNSGRMLAVVFTLREPKIRVISSRDQNKKERKAYGEKI